MTSHAAAFTLGQISRSKDPSGRLFIPTDPNFYSATGPVTAYLTTHTLLDKQLFKLAHTYKHHYATRRQAGTKRMK